MTEHQSSPPTMSSINDDSSLTERPRGLSEARNIDGRPIWEPPILNYSHLIDTPTSQSYTKRRKAVLEFTGGDVATTTLIMDIYTESELLTDYIEYAKSNIGAVEDDKAKRFYETLRDDLREDLMQKQVGVNPGAPNGIKGGDGWIRFKEPEEGKWTLQEPEEWVVDDEDFDCLGEYEEVDDGEQFGSIIARIPDTHDISMLKAATNFQPGLKPNLGTAGAASSELTPLALRLLSLRSPKHDDDID